MESFQTVRAQNIFSDHFASKLFHLEESFLKYKSVVGIVL